MTDLGSPGPHQAPAATHDATAVMGRRILAWLIDLVLYLAVAVGTFALLAEYVEIPPDFGLDACGQLRDTDPSAAGGCVELGDRAYITSDRDNGLQTLVSLGYLAFFVVVQGVAGGSPGKLVVGLRVVDEQGQRAGVGRSLVRTLLWVVDGAPWFAPLVGFITGLTTTGHRRVGDMAAKTYVVGRGDAGHPLTLPSFDPADLSQRGYGGQVPPSGSWSPPPMAGSATGGPPVAQAPSTPAVDDLVPEISGVPDDGPAQPPGPPPRPEVPDLPAPAEPAPVRWEDPSPADPSGSEWAPPTTPGEEFGTTADPSPTAGPAPFVAPGSDPAVEKPSTDTGPAPLPPPQWDPARNTYLQWEPNQQQWLQWDAVTNRWKAIDT